MRVALKQHPDTPCKALSSLEVTVERPCLDEIVLTYFLGGNISRLALPTAAPRDRVDELWKHTCFEAFVDPGDGYLELNVAPSGKWASYEFVAYREGMSPAERVVLNTLEYAFGDEHGELRVSFVGLPPIDAWRLGVAAVIEDIDGRKSYWALAHPADKPDFHHHDAFALTVSADNA